VCTDPEIYFFFTVLHRKETCGPTVCEAETQRVVLVSIYRLQLFVLGW